MSSVSSACPVCAFCCVFCYACPAPTVLSTLSLHDALPISAGCADSVFERGVLDRNGPRARERTPDLPRLQGTRTSACESFAGRRLRRRRSRQHHHDESVEVADLGVRHLFHGWRPGAARIQIDTGRAMASAQAFERYLADHGISDLAATRRLGWPRCRDERANRAGDGSTGKCRSRRRAALGRFSRRRRACVHRAQTPGHGLHRLLFRDGRPPEGLHDDARELSGAVRRAHIDLSILAGRTLPQYPANEPCHRFHGGFFRSVYVRRNGRAFAHVASRIRARSFSEIQNHLCESRSTRFEKLTEKLASAL